MTVEQLNTFLSVCENMSFTKAAKQQYISQPAVSRQMAALEDALGTPLFERVHSTIQLTPAAEHLAVNLKPIMERLQALLNQVHEISLGQRGSLVIGLMLDQALDSRISHALQRFCQRHNAVISIYRYSIMELLTRLQNGSVDFAVSVESTENMFAGCERYIYVQEKMCFAARQDLLLRAGGDRIDENAVIRFAQQYPILYPRLDNFPPESRPMLADKVKRDTFTSMEIGYDLDSIAPMVSAGLAATIVNESHSLAVDQGVVLYNYAPDHIINKGIFWMSDCANPLVPLFCKCLREQVEGGAAGDLWS